MKKVVALIVPLIATLLSTKSNASIKLKFYGADFITISAETFRYPEYPSIEVKLVREGDKAFLNLPEGVTFGFDQLVPGAHRTTNDKLARADGSKIVPRELPPSPN